jgi:hypothetical protein
MSHEAFFRLSPPGTPPSLEFFAVDVWYDAEDMSRHYEDPEMEAGFGQCSWASRRRRSGCIPKAIGANGNRLTRRAMPVDTK